MNTYNEYDGYEPTTEDLKAYRECQEARETAPVIPAPTTYIAPADQYTWGYTLRSLIGPDSTTWAEGVCATAAAECGMLVSLGCSLEAHASGIWARMSFYDMKPKDVRKVAVRISQRGFRVRGRNKTNLDYECTYSGYSNIPTGTVCTVRVLLIPHA